MLIQIQPQGSARVARVPDIGSANRPLSVSQIKNWLKCPWSWYAKSALKLPDPASGSLVIGRALHATALHFFRSRIAQEEATEATTLDLFDHAISAELADARLDQAEALDTRATAARIFPHWWKHVQPGVKPALLESTVRAEINSVHVVGVVDCEEQDGTINDLKTKKRRPPMLDPADAFQLALYAEMREASRVRVDYVYPTGHIPFSWEVTDAERCFVRNLLPTIAESMNSGLVPPNRMGTLCSRTWCNFADACEREWGGTVRP